MTSAGIFGPKLSGKTTLAKVLSKQYWQKAQIRSLVLDINNDGEEWGEHALVFSDEDKFWEAVWKTQKCVIIVDEGSTTISRDRSLIPVFTRMRHCLHTLIVVGHDGTDLLPIMRRQLDTVYLFRQPKSAAKIWAENFAQDGLLQTVSLKQYEFISFTSFGVLQRSKLKI